MRENDAGLTCSDHLSSRQIFVDVLSLRDGRLHERQDSARRRARRTLVILQLVVAVLLS